MFIYLLMECHLSSAQDLFFNFWSKFSCKRTSGDITMNVVMEKPIEWYWGNSKKNCTYEVDIWSPHNRYTLTVCPICQRNLWIHITSLYMSVDHLLEKPVDVKNVKPIPDMVQVHKAIRLMDISCNTIDFFRLSSDVDPYYTQWYGKTCDHKWITQLTVIHEIFNLKIMMKKRLVNG